jgi:pimeloyl-ACP methyl ester carboxylesterase
MGYHDRVTSETITLRDGRKLGYAEYGDPNGRAAFVFHGFPNSRLMAKTGDAGARRRGIRVIALDRPGFGLSDFQPGRQIDDWPDDVAQVADQLGIERFSIMGISGGGPYTAACAAKMPERLEAVGLVSALGPMRDKEAMSGYGRFTRFMLWLSRYLPFLITLTLLWLAFAMRWFPERAIRAAARGRGLPPADRALLRESKTHNTIIADLREAFRQGVKGPAYEFRLFLRPWRFKPEDITARVRIWHGEADDTVPPSMARYYERTIPNAKATFFPGEGHFMVLNRGEEINNELFAAA